EESSPKHKYHASLLIEHGDTRLLIDYGKLHKQNLSEIKPTHIALTHAHPDHAFGFKDEEKPVEIPVYARDVTFDTLPDEISDMLRKKRRMLRYNPYRVDGIILRAIPVSHSIKCPTNGFIVTVAGTRIGYFPDVLSITLRKQVLKNLEIYIGDGSYLTNLPGRVRRDPSTGRPYGHALMRDQVKWAKEAGAKVVIFTHFGKQAIEHPEQLQKAFEEWKKEFDIEILEATDGMVLELRRLGYPGIYLVDPHGRWIFEGNKTLIVSAKPVPKEYLNKEVVVCSDDKAFGTIVITECAGPLAASFVRRYLRDKHRVSNEEWKKWWGDRETVFVYKFRVEKAFDEPVPVKVPKGIQKWIKSVDITLEEGKDIIERVEDLHNWVKSKVNLREFSDSVWLKNEEWFGKKVCPTREHEWLMALSWAHRPTDAQLKIYHQVKEAFDKLNKHIHELTDKEIESLPYQVDWEFEFLKRTRDFLKRHNLTFEQFIDRIANFDSLVIRTLLQIMLKTTSSKIIEVFMRDYLRKPAFPIDFHVATVLEKFKIPKNSELIVAVCRYSGICPKTLNRAIYSIHEVELSAITPEEVKEVLKNPEILKDWSDKRLLDDHKYCHLWAGKGWKTLPKDLTREEVVKLHELIVEEMKRRGFEHDTPLTLESSIESIVDEIKQPSPFAPIHHYGEELGREITLDEVLKAYEKPIVLKRPYVSLVGGIANWGKSKGDIDLFINDPYRDSTLHKPLEFRLGRALPPEIAHRASFNYDYYGGPFTNYVPLYDLVLVPSSLRQLIRMEGGKIVRTDKSRKSERSESS
ncbi:MAG: MBL fold metallo-hydrolase, partial [Candidatus Thorarchaeota archaeon]